MQIGKEQVHQVWLQCMQMTDCSPQVAAKFVHQVRPLLDTPLTPSRQTLLMLAASTSSPHLVKAALQAQPNIHLRDAIGRTALHYAAAVGSLEIFEMLVRAGSGPEEVTIGGETPLSKACIFGQGDIIEWYLNNSLSTFELADKMGKKPLEALKTGGEGLYEQVQEVYRQLTQDALMAD